MHQKLLCTTIQHSVANLNVCLVKIYANIKFSESIFMLPGVWAFKSGLNVNGDVKRNKVNTD